MTNPDPRGDEGTPGREGDEPATRYVSSDSANYDSAPLSRYYSDGGIYWPEEDTAQQPFVTPAPASARDLPPPEVDNAAASEWATTDAQKAWAASGPARQAAPTSGPGHVEPSGEATPEDGLGHVTDMAGALGDERDGQSAHVTDMAGDSTVETGSGKVGHVTDMPEGPTLEIKSSAIPAPVASAEPRQPVEPPVPVARTDVEQPFESPAPVVAAESNETLEPPAPVVSAESGQFTDRVSFVEAVTEEAATVEPIGATVDVSAGVGQVEPEQSVESPVPVARTDVDQPFEPPTPVVAAGPNETLEPPAPVVSAEAVQPVESTENTAPADSTDDAPTPKVLFEAGTGRGETGHVPDMSQRPGPRPNPWFTQGPAGAALPEEPPLIPERMQPVLLPEPDMSPLGDARPHPTVPEPPERPEPREPMEGRSVAALHGHGEPTAGRASGSEPEPSSTAVSEPPSSAETDAPASSSQAPATLEPAPSASSSTPAVHPEALPPQSHDDSIVDSGPDTHTAASTDVGSLEHASASAPQPEPRPHADDQAGTKADDSAAGQPRTRRNAETNIADESESDRHGVGAGRAPGVDGNLVAATYTASMSDPANAHAHGNQGTSTLKSQDAPLLGAAAAAHSGTVEESNMANPSATQHAPQGAETFGQPETHGDSHNGPSVPGDGAGAAARVNVETGPAASFAPRLWPQFVWEGLLLVLIALAVAGFALMWPDAPVLEIGTNPLTVLTTATLILLASAVAISARAGTINLGAPAVAAAAPSVFAFFSRWFGVEAAWPILIGLALIVGIILALLALIRVPAWFSGLLLILGMAYMVRYWGAFDEALRPNTEIAVWATVGAVSVLSVAGGLIVALKPLRRTLVQARFANSGAQKHNMRTVSTTMGALIVSTILAAMAGMVVPAFMAEGRILSTPLAVFTGFHPLGLLFPTIGVVGIVLLGGTGLQGGRGGVFGTVLASLLVVLVAMIPVDGEIGYGLPIMFLVAVVGAALLGIVVNAILDAVARPKIRPDQAMTMPAPDASTSGGDNAFVPGFDANAAPAAAAPTVHAPAEVDTSQVQPLPRRQSKLADVADFSQESSPEHDATGTVPPQPQSAPEQPSMPQSQPAPAMMPAPSAQPVEETGTPAPQTPQTPEQSQPQTTEQPTPTPQTTEQPPAPQAQPMPAPSAQPVAETGTPAPPPPAAGVPAWPAEPAPSPAASDVSAATQSGSQPAETEPRTVETVSSTGDTEPVTEPIVPQPGHDAAASQGSKTDSSPQTGAAEDKASENEPAGPTKDQVQAPEADGTTATPQAANGDSAHPPYLYRPPAQ